MGRSKVVFQWVFVWTFRPRATSLTRRFTKIHWCLDLRWMRVRIAEFSPKCLYFRWFSEAVFGRNNLESGQIIATSHDLTPNGGLAREIPQVWRGFESTNKTWLNPPLEIPLFQGNLGWWNIIIWPVRMLLIELVIPQKDWRQDGTVQILSWCWWIALILHILSSLPNQYCGNTVPRNHWNLQTLRTQSKTTLHLSRFAFCFLSGAAGTVLGTSCFALRD